MSQTRETINMRADVDPGENFKTHLFVGWAILWRLSDSAQSVLVDELNLNAADINCVSSLTLGLDTETLKSLEAFIRNRQVAYISTLSNHGLICKIVLYKCFFSRTFSDRIFSRLHYLGKDCWLSWLVLREGPSYFIKAWSTAAGNEECSRYTTREWSGRTREQIRIENAAGKFVSYKLFSAFDWPKCGMLPWTLLNSIKRKGFTQQVPDNLYFYLCLGVPEDSMLRIEEDYSGDESDSS
jgi:hypothetical protein